MGKKIRFPLKLSEGAEVRTLEELREHFDLEAVLEYYKNGKLLTWLEDRYLEGEAEAVQALDTIAPDFQRRLCEVFRVEYTGGDIDLKAIERRQERLKRLRSITDEAEYLRSLALQRYNGIHYESSRFALSADYLAVFSDNSTSSRASTEECIEIYSRHTPLRKVHKIIAKRDSGLIHNGEVLNKDIVQIACGSSSNCSFDPNESAGVILM